MSEDSPRTWKSAVVDNAKCTKETPVVMETEAIREPTALITLPRMSQESMSTKSSPRKITVYRLNPSRLPAHVEGLAGSNRVVMQPTKKPVYGQSVVLNVASNSLNQISAVDRMTNLQKSEIPLMSSLHDEVHCVKEADDSWYQKIATSERIPITCRNNHAFLYRSKLGSGKKGKCILFEENWYTPSEFENHCGLEMSKDWKRSLRYGGQSMQSLVQRGLLRPHASNCMCGTCCDDKTIVGPIRFYTPKLRRKRNSTSAFPQSPSSSENNKNDMKPFLPSGVTIPHGSTTTKSIGDQILPEITNLFKSTSLPFHQIVKCVFQVVSNAAEEDRKSWAVLKSQADEIFDKYAKLQESIERTKLECDERRNNLLQQIISTLKNCNESDRVISTKTLHLAKSLEDHDDVVEDETITEICRACGQPANSECTGCHKATYCSTECQEKDWNAGHREICRGLQSHGSNSRDSVDGLIA